MTEKNKTGKTVRLSNATVAYLKKHGHVFESVDKVIKRLLGITKETKT